MEKLFWAALFISILFIVQASYAQTFTLSGKDSITVATQTTRQVDITIESSIDDILDLNAIDIMPWMTLSDSRVTILEGGSSAVSIFVSPGQDVMLGKYKLTFTARSTNTGEEQEKSIFINVEKGEILDIEKIVVQGDLQPTGTANIEVSIKNFKTVTESDIGLKTSVFSTTKIAEFDNIIEKIDPSESLTISNALTFEKFTPPGVYTVIVKLFGEEPQEITQTFRVVSRPVIAETREEGATIIGITKTITITNNGNVASESYEIRDSIAGLSSIFYFGDPPKSRNGIFIWEITDLAPGESAQISYSINYLPIVILALFIILTIWYGLFRVKNIKIKKYLMQKKRISKGGEFTVGIEISNNLSGKVENIIVSDFIPSVFDIKESHGPAPQKKRTAAGLELRWDIKRLSKGEERILVYKLIPIFGVQGHIRLPPAKVAFTYKKRTFLNESGFANIGIKNPKDDEE